MEKIFLLATVAMMLLSACSSSTDDGSMSEATSKSVTVRMDFTGYEMVPMSKATTNVSEVISRLDIWIYGAGSETAAYHQQTGDEGFGSLAVTLDKTKTYTIYAVGHKGAEAATLADGIVAFPDDYNTQTLWYTQTFTPSETTALSCLMTRIVGQFSMQTTDQAPDEAVSCRMDITNAWTRWNVSTLSGTNEINRTHTWPSFSVRSDGTCLFNAWIISTDDATKNHNITVTFFDNNGNEVQSRTFENVPIRNGYKTTYRGSFFTDTDVNATFTVGDWNMYDEVAF